MLVLNIKFGPRITSNENINLKEFQQDSNKELNAINEKNTKIIFIKSGKQDNKRLSRQLQILLGKGNHTKKRRSAKESPNVIKPLCHGFYSRRASILSNDSNNQDEKNDIDNFPEVTNKEKSLKKIDLRKIKKKKIIKQSTSSRKTIKGMLISTGNTAESTESFGKLNDTITHERDKIIRFNRVCISNLNVRL